MRPATRSSQRSSSGGVRIAPPQPGASARVQHVVRALFVLLLSPPLASFVDHGGGDQRRAIAGGVTGLTPRRQHRQMRTSLLLLLVLSRHAPVATAMQSGERSHAPRFF
jgi:hypothetical protein